MDSYVTVKEQSEFTYEDRKSEFIGLCKPIKTESEAIEFIQAVKKKFPDARHWVYAYVLRENSTMRFTDDREPQGTAGMPVLDIIRKNGVTDVIIVVVRYFGGILLGTGGLVHAYTESALGALKSAGIIEYNVYTTAAITLSYSDYQKVGTVFVEYDFKETDIEYTDNVLIFGSVKEDCFDEFNKKLVEVTSGRCKIDFIDKKYDFRE